MPIPTIALRNARIKAGINQGDMAKLLDVSSNSVVSRLEKSEFTDYPMAERYLKAIGTDSSLAVLDYYSRNWRISKLPDFRHPDKDALWQAELALQKLEEFEEAEGFDSLLTDPLNFIRNTLKATADYVGQTHHTLAWIGTVGIGKTTALSHLTNLILTSPSGRPRPIFPASGGRTTTSEVVVRPAPAFGVAVEPKSVDEIYLLVAEMVEAIADGKGGISTELERAIRNMAEIQKRKDPADTKALIDPVRDMLASNPGSKDDVVQAIVAKMHIDQRTETQMILSENDSAGLEWLSNAVTDINFGKHPRFSIPHRVTVFVPDKVMRKSRYDLTIIDTKGIHGTTERPDLQALTSDPRTLSILCCSFNDAPGQEPLNILKNLKDMGSDAIERQRILLLALPRADEAIKVIDDSGEPVESVEEGYAFRSGQVSDSLKQNHIPEVPILYFNAIEDGSAKVWEDICGHVYLIRQRQLDRLEKFTLLAAELMTNADAHRIQQARVTLAREAAAIVEAYKSLPVSVLPAQQRLLREMKNTHPSSIAAAALRNGSWYNLDVHHIVGAGVRADANRRTVDLIKKIEGRLEALQGQFASTPEASALVETLLEDLSDWHQEFLIRALAIGRNTFKPHLDNDSKLWSRLKTRYGKGTGYREEVIDMVEKWFESSDLNEVRTKIDLRLEDAWRELFLEQLIEATALDEIDDAN